MIGVLLFGGFLAILGLVLFLQSRSKKTAMKNLDQTELDLRGITLPPGSNEPPQPRVPKVG